MRQPRSGFSLIEVMIAMTMTLIVLGAMMAAFAYGSQEMRKGRAAVNLMSKLQVSAELLRSDLDKITLEAKPHHFEAGSAAGYLEIVDGSRTDFNREDLETNSRTGGDNSYRGDNDDIIAFTGKATEEPFLASSGGSIRQSHYAEIVWFASGGKLYRKISLIRPDQLNGKSLEELGYRANRLGHIGGKDPHTSQLSRAKLLSDCDENDVVLRNVVAFDVQVYDPDAFRFAVRSGSQFDDPIVGVIGPSEIGARLGVGAGRMKPISKGAFVDLGKGGGRRGARPVLFGPPHFRYGNEAVYDTGTSKYDNDQENDRGNNGVDDFAYFNNADPNGIIDDAAEKVSVPPYNVPLRGVKISIRVMDPLSKQVRQLTVIKSLSVK